MRVFPGVPSMELARVISGAMALASEPHRPLNMGTSAHVLLVLVQAMPKVAAAVERTGVTTGTLRAAADSGPPERDYDFEPAEGGRVGVVEFVGAVLRDEGTEAGRLATAWGWTRDDVEAIEAGAGGVVPIPLPGWVLGSDGAPGA